MILAYTLSQGSVSVMRLNPAGTSNSEFFSRVQSPCSQLEANSKTLVIEPSFLVFDPPWFEWFHLPTQLEALKIQSSNFILSQVRQTWRGLHSSYLTNQTSNFNLFSKHSTFENPFTAPWNHLASIPSVAGLLVLTQLKFKGRLVSNSNLCIYSMQIHRVRTQQSRFTISPKRIYNLKWRESKLLLQISKRCAIPPAPWKKHPSFFDVINQIQPSLFHYSYHRAGW